MIRILQLLILLAAVAGTATSQTSGLNFLYQIGGALPAPQLVQLGNQLAVTAAVTTNTGGNWLTVNLVPGDTPPTLTVIVNPTGLLPGVYTGSVRVTSAGAVTVVTVTLTVTSATTIILTPSTTTPALTETVAYSVTVTSGPPAPQGSVIINEGQTVLCRIASLTVSSAGNTSLGSCSVKYDNSDVQHGLLDHKISATYSPISTSWAPATSQNATVTVGAAITSVGTPTSSSGNTFPFGTTTAFSAVVTPTPLCGNGSLAFSVDGAPIATISVNTATGRATTPAVTLPAGGHRITASYSGSAPTCEASTSLPTVITVTAAPTFTTLITSSSTVALSSKVTLTYTVTASTPTGTPPLSGLAVIDETLNTIITCPASGVAGTASSVTGACDIVYNGPDAAHLAGRHSYRATFTPPDNRWEASTSSAVSVDVTYALAMTLSTTSTSPAGTVVHLALPPYPLPLVCSPSVSFVPDSSVAFATNLALRNNASFATPTAITIPAFTNGADLSIFQPGSVAGRNTISLSGCMVTTTGAPPTGGTSVDLTNPPSIDITVVKDAPNLVPGSVKLFDSSGGNSLRSSVVQSAAFTRPRSLSILNAALTSFHALPAADATSTFRVLLDATSNTRDLQTATFTFAAVAGKQLSGAVSFTIDLNASPIADTSVSYFSGAAGLARGGTFSMDVTFQASGDLSILDTVSVTLKNSVGTSVPVLGGR